MVPDAVNFRKVSRLVALSAVKVLASGREPVAQVGKVSGHFVGNGFGMPPERGQVEVAKLVVGHCSTRSKLKNGSHLDGRAQTEWTKLEFDMDQVEI